MARSLSGWVEVAGKLRDGFLVTAGICYFFGYIVWAINAYNNGLGLLPALDFQYFVAGAPTVLTILGLYYLFAGIWWLIKAARGWVNTQTEGGRRLLNLFVLLIGLIAFVGIYINTTEWFKATFPRLANLNLLVLICALVIVLCSLFLPTRENPPPSKDIPVPSLPPIVAFLPLQENPEPAETPDENEPKKVFFRELFWNFVDAVPAPFLRLLGIIYAGMFGLGLVALAGFYILKLYPMIPQEFGGGRPSYACLDVVKAQISNRTLEGILPTEANQSNEPVVRSLRVEVLFSGSDVMVVRSQGRVYKITKSTIQAVATCD
jgi:hypothetical protein